MRIRIFGCDQETGTDTEVDVEAATVDEAIAKANKLGVFVSRVEINAAGRPMLSRMSRRIIFLSLGFIGLTGCLAIALLFLGPLIQTAGTPGLESHSALDFVLPHQPSDRVRQETVTGDRPQKRTTIPYSDPDNRAVSAVATSAPEPSASVAHNIWNDLPIEPTKHWSHVQITEAFPGSLANYDEPGSMSGGASGSGSADKASFSANATGHMAVAWVDWGGTDQFVMGRSLDAGLNWERYTTPVSKQGVLGTVGPALISARYAGNGPRVQMLNDGTAICVIQSGSSLATFVWPPETSAPHVGSQIDSRIPIRRCGDVIFENAVHRYEVYANDDSGAAVLVVELKEEFGREVRAYEFAIEQWVQLGEAVPGINANATFDSDSGVLYLCVLQSPNTGRGLFPVVMAWNAAVASWRSLETPASGSRLTKGISGYIGAADDMVPTIAAAEGRVWCFWKQESPLWIKGLDDSVVQGAVWHDGEWGSAARTSLAVGYEEWDDRESYGPGGGIVRLDAQNAFAFYDDSSNTVVLIIDSVQVFRLYEDHGFAADLLARHANGRVLVRGSQAGRNKWVWSPSRGLEYSLVSRSAGMTRNTGSIMQQGRDVYLCAVAHSGGRSSDVFIFKLNSFVPTFLGVELRAWRRGDPRPAAPVVSSVQPDSLADRAGILQGDSIQAINGEGMHRPNYSEDLNALIRLIKATPPEMGYRFDILRDGESRRIEVPAASRRTTAAPH